MMRAFPVIIWIIAMPLLSMAQRKDSLTIRNGELYLKDSIPKKDTAVHKISESKKPDTLAKHKHSPRKAAIYSAILPGLGQIYNKKYWKVPIVYAAVGIPAGLFIYNKNWYDRTRYALAIVANNTTDPDSLSRIHSRLRPLVDLKAEGSLLNYRNEFRKNMDYSILFGLLFWGLNVVDATVDAHLKGFDITDDISLKIKPAILSGGTATGISFVFTFGENRPKTLPSLR